MNKRGLRTRVMASYCRLVEWWWLRNSYLISRSRNDPEDARMLGASWQQASMLMHILGFTFLILTGIEAITGGGASILLAIGGGLMALAGQAWWRLGSVLLRAGDTQWRQDLIVWLAQVGASRREYRAIEMAEAEGGDFLAKVVSEMTDYTRGMASKDFLGRMLGHQNKEVRIAAIKLANTTRARGGFS